MNNKEKRTRTLMAYLILIVISLIMPSHGSSSSAAASASTQHEIDTALDFARCIRMTGDVLVRFQDQAWEVLRKNAFAEAHIHADANLWSAHDLFLVVMETRTATLDASGAPRMLHRLASIVSPVGQYVIKSAMTPEEHETVFAHFLRTMSYSLTDVTESLTFVACGKGSEPDTEGCVEVVGTKSAFRFLKVRTDDARAEPTYSRAPRIYKSAEHHKPSADDIRSITLSRYGYPDSRL